eukprot:FR741650.1.p1 GENE.FR741650.1~~FR741650.1.p1  ORF type:complete len:242 (+),score=24.29 FR741650.1:87-728(+)
MRRYTFYFERYTQYKQGVKAVPHLKQTANENIRSLVEGVSDYRNTRGINHLDPAYFNFIGDMVDLVERCRRVLQWSYVFTYFLPPKSPQMNILQSQQGKMESMTDHLHEQLATLDAKTLLHNLEDGDDTLVFNWTFKQEATTHEAALGNFLRNVSNQIRDWEESGVLEVAAEDSLSGAAEESVNNSWFCLQCTFENTHLSHQAKCEMCKAPRP